ncbi:unnamed protein product [Diplocarpon coronariae]
MQRSYRTYYQPTYILIEMLSYYIELFIKLYNYLGSNTATYYAEARLGEPILSSGSGSGRSTLLDNCAATHIVNSKDLLVAGTFKPSGDSQQYIEAGTSRLLIIGRGDRYMADSLLQRDGSPMGMTLRNVAVVEEFTTNIISERLLADKGFWYSSVDLTLRSGSIEDSVKRAQLEPETTLYNRFQSSYAPTRVRDDDAYTWHLRASHLGAEALQALVKCARGVKIRGIQRLECPVCAVASARQVISRATFKNRSPRPFFRISWDLFDFPDNSYNSCS